MSDLASKKDVKDDKKKDAKDKKKDQKQEEDLVSFILFRASKIVNSRKK